MNEELLREPGVSVADFRGETQISTSGDSRDGLLYRYTPNVKLAVRVALAVGRPLLVFGPSGCGKSSLVFNLARLLRRRYYEFVVTSRSEARDLYYRFDSIRRLGEAQLGDNGSWRSPYRFIEPGPLWWVFSPATAVRRGNTELDPSVPAPIDPGRWPDSYEQRNSDQVRDNEAAPPAVLLIDEIDKAEPDFANNLLVPLGSRQFVVQETADLVTLGSERDLEPALIVITSNRERELAPAFVRRCVVLQIEAPTVDDLLDMARIHFPNSDESARSSWRRIAELTTEIRRQEPVSAPEFLDAVRAIDSLRAEEPQWREILLSTTWTNEQGDM